MDKMVENCDQTMQKRLETLDKDLSRVRTGRASVSILDGVKVNYYGNMSPLNQVASLSTPDARTILVAPFEKKLLGEIERSIQMADVGIQPTNDGNVIRLPIPPLSEERRKELAKSIKKLGEEVKVSLRMIRQDFNNQVKQNEKDKKINEDDGKKLLKDIQTVTDNTVKKVDDKVAKKEKEVLTL